VGDHLAPPQDGEAWGRQQIVHLGEAIIGVRTTKQPGMWSVVMCHARPVTHTRRRRQRDQAFEPLLLVVELRRKRGGWSDNADPS